MQEIILASQSPRRKMLLEWAQVPFEIIVSNTEEDFPIHLEVEQVPVYIAKKKAVAVQEKITLQFNQHVNKCIVAADTIVVLDNLIFGKPNNKQEAIKSLTSLSGKTHQVITGVVLLFEGKEYSFHEITHVSFNHLTSDQIEFYVDQYKPYDKAGGYAIQEWIGVIGIEQIHGDFYNVMGLPVNKLMQQFRLLGIQ